MRIAINLASKPFVELRPLFAQLRLVMAALAVLACGLGLWLHNVSASEQQDAVQMDVLKTQTLAVQQRTAGNEARMHLPQNQGVLARSEFLNGLFARKAFSWTAVMMDLEHVLPEGVQVTSIDPVIAKDGAVSIRLRVTGDRDKTIQLVRNLERSKHFVDARLAGESALNADKAKAIGANLQNVSAGAADLNGGAVEFEIFSGYQPLEPESSEAAAEGHRPANEASSRSRTGAAR